MAWPHCYLYDCYVSHLKCVAVSLYQRCNLISAVTLSFVLVVTLSLLVLSCLNQMLK